MELHERVWQTDDPKGAVVIVHGLAEHSGRYEHVAQALNQAGYSVYARDARGHGRSPGFPGDMGQDIDALVQDIVSLCLGVKNLHEDVFLLAHSVGTLFALPAVASIPAGTLTGVVLSGTAIMPGPATMESLTTGEGVPPSEISRDPDVVKAYTEDDLVFYDRVPPEVMGMAAEAIGKAMEAVPLISVPVLLVHGLADTICDISGAQNVHTQLVTTDKTLRVYEGLFHEVLNEPERDTVLQDIVGWMDERLG